MQSFATRKTDLPIRWELAALAPLVHVDAHPSNETHLATGSTGPRLAADGCSRSDLPQRRVTAIEAGSLEGRTSGRTSTVQGRNAQRQEADRAARRRTGGRRAAPAAVLLGAAALLAVQFPVSADAGR